MMNVKEYMGREFQLVQKRVDDVGKAYEHMSPGKTMTESEGNFDAHKHRTSFYSATNYENRVKNGEFLSL